MSTSTTQPFLVEELKRYSRQLYLPQVRLSGQLKLKNATALIVGLGGLGSPCAIYLSASGLGKIILADFDKVELSNLQRQVIHQQQNIGINKAISAEQSIKELNSNCETKVITHRLVEKEWLEIINDVDVVLDCSDNFETRYLINKTCLILKKPLVSASVIAFNGQLICFNYLKNDSPCYACLFPESKDHIAENCSESGVLATSAGILATMQAHETLKLLMGLEFLLNKLLVLDTLTWQQRTINVNRDKNCKVCSNYYK